MARSLAQTVSGLAVTGFALAVAALVSSQLMLMSVLDPVRAERAAEQIAASRFVADVVFQTVDRAVTPFVGDALGDQLALAASTDPRVEQTVERALIDAHRQIVDPDSGDDVAADGDGNAAVDTAIAASVLDAATAAGIDLAALGAGGVDAGELAAVAEQAGLPSVVPDDVPALGLERVAETTRVIAGLAAFVFGAIAVIAHPRPGRGLARLGFVTVVVCAAWLIGLLVGGWVIDLIAQTLFGEMLDEVWRDAVPSMLLLTIGGAVIGLGLWFGGITLDGLARSRRQRLDVR